MLLQVFCWPTCPYGRHAPGRTSGSEGRMKLVPGSSPESSRVTWLRGIYVIRAAFINLSVLLLWLLPLVACQSYSPSSSCPGHLSDSGLCASASTQIVSPINALSVCVSASLSVCLSVCVSASLSVCLSVCVSLSVSFSIFYFFFIFILSYRNIRNITISYIMQRLPLILNY